MKCTTCGTAMKPLLTSWYCPRDCDKPKAAEAPESFKACAKRFYQLMSPGANLWYVVITGPAQVLQAFQPGQQFVVHVGSTVYKDRKSMKLPGVDCAVLGLSGVDFAMFPRASTSIGTGHCVPPHSGVMTRIDTIEWLTP